MELVASMWAFGCTIQIAVARSTIGAGWLRHPAPMVDRFICRATLFCRAHLGLHKAALRDHGLDLDDRADAARPPDNQGNVYLIASYAFTSPLP
jgi:hypothetical protein